MTKNKEQAEDFFEQTKAARARLAVIEAVLNNGGTYSDGVKAARAAFGKGIEAGAPKATNNSKHTPAPLTTKHRGCGTVGLIIQSDGKTIGTAHTAEDARLWAAAPELLAALESALEICEYNAKREASPAIALMRAAIAKAKGE